MKKMSLCLSSLLGAAFCLIISYPALHYRTLLHILALTLLVLGLLAGIFETPPPKV